MDSGEPVEPTDWVMDLYFLYAKADYLHLRMYCSLRKQMGYHQTVIKDTKIIKSKFLFQVTDAQLFNENHIPHIKVSHTHIFVKTGATP